MVGKALGCGVVGYWLGTEVGLCVGLAVVGRAVGEALGARVRTAVLVSITPVTESHFAVEEAAALISRIRVELLAVVGQLGAGGRSWMSSAVCTVTGHLQHLSLY